MAKKQGTKTTKTTAAKADKRNITDVMPLHTAWAIVSRATGRIESCGGQVGIYDLLLEADFAIKGRTRRNRIAQVHITEVVGG